MGGRKSEYERFFHFWINKSKKSYKELEANMIQILSRCLIYLIKRLISYMERMQIRSLR